MFYRVCIGELIETEEEFGKDISTVVEHYLTPLEEELRPAPRAVMDNKDIIFNNLFNISAFHNGFVHYGSIDRDVCLFNHKHSNKSLNGLHKEERSMFKYMTLHLIR